MTDKIDELLKLTDGWHYGEGKQISERAGAVARILRHLFVTLGLVHGVYPTLQGGITFSFDHPNIEITVDADGELSLFE